MYYFQEGEAKLIIAGKPACLEPQMAGKKREKVAALTRSIILESAYELFRENGIDGTTMDDISRHSEYSKSSIYKYFGSKDGIVCHLIYEGIEYLQGKLQEDAKQSQSFADFYRRFYTSIADIREKYPLYYDGIVGALPFEYNAPASDIRKKIYIAGETLNEIVEERIAKGMADGEIASEEDLSGSAIFMRFCLMGIVDKIALKEEYLAYKLGKTKEEFMEFAFSKLLKLFISPPSPPKKKR